MPCPGSQSPVGCARTLWWSSRLPHAWGGGHGRLPVVKLAVSGVKHPRLSVVKFPDLAPVTWKYCWSCENSCASQPQCAGLSETAKNWFDPIFMGEYRGNSILISLECVKYLYTCTSKKRSDEYDMCESCLIPCLRLGGTRIRLLR